MDELERTFRRYAADGSTSFVPARHNRVVNLPSEEEEESEEEQDEDYMLTALNIGSKRTRSTQSTCSMATSWKKKVKSPAVRAMVSVMKDFSANYKERTAVMEGYLSRRRKDRDEAKAEKVALIDCIQKTARECGVTEENTQLWFCVLKMIKDDDAVQFFLLSNPAGRRRLIEHYAKDDVAAPTRAVNTDDSKDELEFLINSFFDDSEDVGFMYGLSCCMEVLPGGLGAVSAMVSVMKDFNANYKEWTALMEGYLSRRRKDRDEAKAEKVALFDRIQKAARECSVTEENTQLWLCVLKMMKDDVCWHFLCTQFVYRKRTVSAVAFPGSNPKFISISRNEQVYYVEPSNLD